MTPVIRYVIEKYYSKATVPVVLSNEKKKQSQKNWHMPFDALELLSWLPQIID